MQNIKSAFLPFLRIRLMQVVFFSVYFLAVIYAMSYFFQNSALGDDYFYTRFGKMMNGDARKPFIYRQLVPMMANATIDVTPETMRDDITRRIENIKTSSDYALLRSAMPWLDKSFPYHREHYARVVVSILNLCFLLGYMGLLYALARAMFPENSAIAWFAPLLGVYAFSSFGYQWQYIYDIPVLCLSTACFYFLFKQQYRAYLLCFVLYCLNKESAIYSLIFFSLWTYKTMDSKPFAFLFTLQCAIYIIIKMSISIYFIDNRGVFLEQNWAIVIVRDLLAKSNISKILDICVLWFLLTFRWQDKPDYLKASLWMMPILMATYILFGFPLEYRVFFDMHGPLVLLATHTLIAGTGIAQSNIFKQKALS